MDLANTFTLEEEIKELIEDYNPDLRISEKEAGSIAKSNSFPFLKYMYKGTSLDKINKTWDQLIETNKIYDSKETYVFNLFEEITIDIYVSEKPTKKYVKLRDILKKEKFKLNKIIDIEFFEYYSRHQFIINHLNGKTQKTINQTEDHRFKEYIKHSFEHQFNDFLGYLKLFGGHNSDELLNFLVDESRIDDRKFTAFLDTEKIHLQFVELEKNRKKEIILAYRGYGNHYPFTKNIPGKKIYDQRYKRFDVLNQNQDLQYYIKEFEKSKFEKNDSVLNWLENCQKNYTSYFEDNFNYTDRKNNFLKRNSKDIMPTSFDDLLKLNPLLRTRASALVAYHYFKENSIF